MDSEYSLPMAMIYTSPGLMGRNPKSLLSVPGFPYWPRWSPDGSRLRISVFDAKTESNSLWEIQADGTHPHPLLPGWNNPSQECCGSWTPDGKYFIFQSTHNGKTQIWAIPEKGGLFRKARWEPTELTTGPTELFLARSQRGRKETFCNRFSAPGRTRTFQPENPTV